MSTISPAEFRTRILSGEVLPDNLNVGGDLALRYCTSLTSLPDNLTVGGSRLKIPVVPDLDKKIAKAVGPDWENLDMRDWHGCGTTHCRGGWAIQLAGEAGKSLEKITSSETAATLIYVKSAGYVPDFYASNEKALMDINLRAGM